jgi:hypothetical protein
VFTIPEINPEVFEQQASSGEEDPSGNRWLNTHKHLIRFQNIFDLIVVSGSSKREIKGTIVQVRKVHFLDCIPQLTIVAATSRGVDFVSRKCSHAPHSIAPTAIMYYWAELPPVDAN